MSLEAVIANLLNVASVKAITGDRISLAQRPADGGYPALVYNVEEIETMNHFSESGALRQGRVQVTALAVEPTAAVSLRQAVVNAMRHQRGTFAGHRVFDVLQDSSGGTERDNDAGIWMTTQDFVVTFYE